MTLNCANPQHLHCDVYLSKQLVFRNNIIFIKYSLPMFGWGFVCLLVSKMSAVN